MPWWAAAGEGAKKVGMPMRSCGWFRGTLLVSVHDADKAEVGGIEVRIEETGHTASTAVGCPARFADLEPGDYTVVVTSDLESRWLRAPKHAKSLCLRCQVRRGRVAIASFEVEPRPLPPARALAGENYEGSRPFKGRDELVGDPAIPYAGGFIEKIELQMDDFAERLRAGYDEVPNRFPEQVDPTLDVPGAPAFSAYLNSSTHWRASLAEGSPDGAYFSKVRVNDNETGWYGTPLRERLSGPGRYDRYNDVLKEHLDRKDVHKIEVFPDVHAETRFVRNYRCFRVRHIRYSRAQYESAMVGLDACLKRGLATEDRRVVIRCAAKITYDVNHLTVTHRGQGAVSELMGLALLQARGIAIPPLTSGDRPIYPWAETAVESRDDFTRRFERWIDTGHWEFWYDDNEYDRSAAGGRNTQVRRSA
ncbi:MAG: hypothetical protein AAF799_02830 [Myxococcota bacterium]